MRVITGSARGRRLNTVPGSDLVRPTSEKVKEAVFSAIQFDIEGRRVLDLFAGSGQMGIEALSRGAENATFVDSSDISLKVVKENLKTTNLSEKATVVKSDSLSFLSRTNEKFDIAFVDPPYSTGLLQKAISNIENVMSDFGIIVCEHPKEETLPEELSKFSVSKNYKFGKITVTVYKRKVSADE